MVRLKSSRSVRAGISIARRFPGQALICCLPGRQDAGVRDESAYVGLGRGSLGRQGLPVDFGLGQSLAHDVRIQPRFQGSGRIGDLLLDFG